MNANQCRAQTLELAMIQTVRTQQFRWDCFSVFALMATKASCAQRILMNVLQSLAKTAEIVQTRQLTPQSQSMHMCANVMLGFLETYAKIPLKLALIIRASTANVFHLMLDHIRVSAGEGFPEISAM
jgi:hypothetical protein